MPFESSIKKIHQVPEEMGRHISNGFREVKVSLRGRDYETSPDPQAEDDTAQKSPETIINNFKEWNGTRPRKPPRTLSKSTEEAIRELQATSEGREKIRDYRNPAYVVTEALKLYRIRLDPSELLQISCVDTIISGIKGMNNPGFDLYAKHICSNENLETAVAALPLDIQHQIIKPTIAAKFVLKSEITGLQGGIASYTNYAKGILKPRIEGLQKGLLSSQEKQGTEKKRDQGFIRGKSYLLSKEEQTIKGWQSAIREKRCLFKVTLVEYEKFLLERQIEDIKTHLTEFINATRDLRQWRYSSEEKIKLMVKSWLSSSSPFSPSVETKDQVLGKKAHDLIADVIESCTNREERVAEINRVFDEASDTNLPSEGPSSSEPSRGLKPETIAPLNASGHENIPNANIANQGKKKDTVDNGDNSAGDSKPQQRNRTLFFDPNSALRGMLEGDHDLYATGPDFKDDDY